MKLEVPKNIQEHFKGKYICYTIFEVDRLIFLFSDYNDNLEISIKKCNCSEFFLDFFEFGNMWNQMYRGDVDIEGCRMDIDESFGHQYIDKYIIKLYFKDSEESAYSFSYYKFNHNCSCSSIEFTKKADL